MNALRAMSETKTTVPFNYLMVNLDTMCHTFRCREAVRLTITNIKGTVTGHLSLYFLYLCIPGQTSHKDKEEMKGT
jgi:hypothetical protein